MRLAHRLADVWRRLSHLLADRGRRRRLFLAYCLAVILAYVASAGLTVRMGILPWARGDFVAYYTGARLLRDGHAQRLYDLALQARVQQDILRPYGFVFDGGLLPYNYPPCLAAALIPMSFLSLRWAFLIWSVANAALILASLALLLDGRERWSRGTFVFISVVTFAFFPVLEGLVKGQSSLVVLFASALTYSALRRDRGYLAGTALAVGLIKPQLVVSIVVYLLYRRRWRAVAGFGVAGGLLLAASCTLVGLGGVKAYAELARRWSAWDAPSAAAPGAMPNVRGTVYRVGLLVDQWLGVQPPEVTLTAATVVLSLGVLALVFQSWRLSRDPAPAAFDLGLAVALTCGLLVSPHLHGHDLTLLVLVGWLVLRYAESTGRGARARRMIAVAHPAPLILPAALPFTLGRQILALLLLALPVVLWRWAVQDRASQQAARL
jgi:hypothetical protein